MKKKVITIIIILFIIYLVIYLTPPGNEQNTIQIFIPEFTPAYQLYYIVYNINNDNIISEDSLVNAKINTINNFIKKEQYIKIFIKEMSSANIISIYNINKLDITGPTLESDNNGIYTIPSVKINILDKN